MWSQDDLLTLVGDIYDAALDPALWPGVLTRLADLVKGAATVLMAHDIDAWKSTITCAVRFDESLAREYNEYYATRNTWTIRGKRYLRPGVVYTSEMACSKEEFERTEYYQDFMRHMSISYGIGGTFAQSEAGDLSFVSATGLSTRGPFGTAEMALLQTLLPHFRRAVQLHARMASVAEERDSARSALERLPCGCVLIGPGGKTLYLNTMAERILKERDGLLLEKRVLRALDARQDRRLQALVGAATQTGLRQGVAPGCAVAISRPSGRRGYAVLIVPVTSTALSEGHKRVTAALFITDPHAAVPAVDAPLRELFALTPAEARLARALAHAGGLRQAAESLGISVNTAKTHLQRIFEKTDTCRQKDLVRLLLSGPQII